jgi:hypothetical protein
MRKRTPVLVAAIALAAVLLCGWTAYAATSAANTVSASVKGTLKSVGEDAVTVTTESGEQTVALAKSVWVYKDDQKAQLADLLMGDQVEFILNSKQQAAYVKATSAAAAAPEPEPEPVAQAAPLKPAASAAAPEPMQPQSQFSSQTPVTAAPKAEAAPQPKQPPHPAQSTQAMVKTGYPDLKDIELNVDGKQLKLHIVQSASANGISYDLSVKPEGSGTVHLKGEQAAAWIGKLLTSIDLRSSDAERAIGQLLASHYNLDASKLNVLLNAKWNDDNQVEIEHKAVSGSKPDSKPDSKPGSKLDSKPDSKHDSKPGNKPDSKPGSKPPGKTDDHKTNQKARGSSGHHDD